MALINKTLDELIEEGCLEIRNLIPGAKTHKGSDYYARASSVAAVVLPIYAQGKYLEAQSDPRTADLDGLQRMAKKWGVPRMGMRFAGGQISISSSNATPIPANTVLVNEVSGMRYKTVGITAIPIGLVATANVIALTAGKSGNAVIGTVLKFESAPAGVNPQATVIAITGGDDEWSLTRWGQEIIKRMNSKPAGGNIAHFQALASTIAGVEQAFVFPALRGPGTTDVVITTGAYSGSRIASVEILSQVSGSFLVGAQIEGGDAIAPIPEHMFANTSLHAAVAQSVKVTIGYKASAQNPCAVWPDNMIVSDENTWWKVTASSSATNFTVARTAGTGLGPSLGDEIGVFFPSTGFCKGTIISMSGSGPIVLGVTWKPVPTETTVPIGAVITPWCSQLPGIAGPPSDATGDGLSGAVPEYFAKLGPGQMTPLTDNDTTRRCRWPQVGQVSPFTDEAFFPTDITARLSISQYTDATDFSIDSDIKTPSIPDAAFIGTPPSLLVLGDVRVIPMS